MNEWSFIWAKWLNPRWLPSSSWVRMIELSQIELVWIRLRVGWECFWVNLREGNKVSESKMAVSESNMANSRWLPSSSWVKMNEFESDWISWVRVRVEWECFGVNLREENKVSESNMAKFKMAAIINLSQNQWVKIFVQMVEPMNKWSFFVQMVGTNLGKCEWVWEEKLRWLNPRWWNSGLENSRWLPSSSWVRMNEFESDWISLNQSQSWVRVLLSESERR